MSNDKKARELDHQIGAIDTEINELRKKAATISGELEDKLARLREKLRERDIDRQKLQRELDRERAELAAEQFVLAAKKLDRDGDSPERLARFERLAAELSFAGRLTQTRYEARSLAFSRMRREGDAGKLYRPPYTNWEALAQAWLKPAVAA